MERLRQARPSDIEPLLELSQTGNFINLPPFRDKVEAMLALSERSFRDVATKGSPPPGHDRTHDNYMLVLETPDGECAGTSAIRGGMITRDHPNLSYQLVKLVRESTLLSKTIHGPEELDDPSDRMIASGRMEHIYAILFQDTACPSELGGNVMHHSMRGRGLGKLLSYARFHYLKPHAEWFSDRILCEMMAPIDRYNDGTPFWRHVIRKFINMTYEDADRLSTHQDKREFMYELLPKFINLSLLDDAVLNSLGTIGEATRPAAEMLKDIGFEITHRVDPFDAGPHLEMKLSDMSALACTPRRVIIADPGSGAIDAVISTEDSPDGFVAVRTRVGMGEGRGGVGGDSERAIVSRETAAALGVEPGAMVRISPLRFRPDRNAAAPIPEINLRDALKRRGPDLSGKRLAALPVNEVAQIIQDKMDTIASELSS